MAGLGQAEAAGGFFVDVCWAAYYGGGGRGRRAFARRAAVGALEGLEGCPQRVRRRRVERPGGGPSLSVRV